MLFVSSLCSNTYTGIHAVTDGSLWLVGVSIKSNNNKIQLNEGQLMYTFISPMCSNVYNINTPKINNNQERI